MAWPVPRLGLVRTCHAQRWRGQSPAPTRTCSYPSTAGVRTSGYPQSLFTKMATRTDLAEQLHRKQLATGVQQAPIPQIGGCTPESLHAGNSADGSYYSTVTDFAVPVQNHGYSEG
eukprot:gene17647-biopygen5136